MISTGLLLIFLLIATWTDVRGGKIYNWTTYPGIVAALTLNALASFLGSAGLEVIGAVGITDCLVGLVSCAAVMLVCYVCFAGGVGGGDLKLMAMTGAFLGLFSGLEVCLWTFVLQFCVALIYLIWQHGIAHLLRRSFRYLVHLVRLGGRFPLTEEDRKPLKPKLYLAPSVLVAVCIVQFNLVH